MKIIVFENKTRIEPLENIFVYDRAGNLFYKAPALHCFNVPAGIYFIAGNYKTVPFRLPSTQLKFPAPEIKTEFNGIAGISIVNNPNKCSIDLKTGRIFIDYSFFQQINTIELLYVLLHEIGHYFYKTESKCDLFASNILSYLGYNPSQIFYASKNTLFDNSRIQNNFNSLRYGK